MNRTTLIGLAFLLGSFAPLVAGCGGGGPDLIEVTGTVTLDNRPLADASVEFQPEEGGSPSYGTTDENGRYELVYGVGKPGAMIGKHVVRITTYQMESTGEGDPTIVPERVPPQYNSQTTLSEEVAPGRNEINFDLTGALQ